MQPPGTPIKPHRSRKGWYVLAGFIALVLAAPAVASAGGLTGAAQVQLVPVGTLAFEAGNVDDSESTEIAYGFGGQVDYWVNDNISVGFAPRVLLNIKPDGESDSASQIDLAARVQYNAPVNEQVKAFGFVAPGYSILSLPDAAGDLSPKGFILGFGGGVRYGLDEKLFVQGEAGYTLGFQGGTEQGTDYTFKTNLLHLGVGVGSAF